VIGGRLNRWVGCAALTGAVLVLSGCPASPRNTQAAKPKKPPPPVNMVVEVGHGNAVRQGQTVPVRVTLSQNAKPITGRLELDDLNGGRTVTPIDLPRGSNKVYTLYAELSQDEHTTSGDSAEIRVHDGGTMLARQALRPAYVKEGSVVISATGDGSGLQFLHDPDQKGLRVTHHSPADLPRQWAGYSPADVVALNGRAWTAMDDEQRRALRMWVESGGRAILCGESTTEWRDPEAAAIVGLEPRTVHSEGSLECLDAWGDVPFVARGGKLLTVSGPLLAGTSTAFRQQGYPLVVARTALRGQVLWMGFDPFRETLRDWEGYQTFWIRAIESVKRSKDPVRVLSPEEVEDARSAANSLPRLPAPPMAAIVAFGVVYALIFGPVNIWILRRLRRTVKSWLFVPALSLGMTVVVLLVGQTWGNTRTVLNSVSVLHAVAGGRTAQERTLIGIFSPTNRAFDLTVDDPAPSLQDRGGVDAQGAAPVSLGWPDLQADGATRWEALPLLLYSTRMLHLERPLDLRGQFDARLTWNGAPAGKLVNGTNIALRGVYLMRNGRRQWVGDLAQGAEVTVRAGAWASGLKEELPDPGKSGQFLENQRFRQSIQALWDHAPSALMDTANSKDVWLIGECADYRSALNVAQVPYSNEAGLMVVRIPKP
jgi:hypothetical protein